MVYLSPSELVSDIKCTKSGSSLYTVASNEHFSYLTSL